MAPLIYLDTHVVVWLYAGRLDLLPPGVRETINESELTISPMVSLELEYLREAGRISEPATKVVETLAAETGLAVCSLPFAQVAQRALHQSWTRDPFDRLIVAQAEARSAALLTKDETIRANFPGAVWQR